MDAYGVTVDEENFLETIQYQVEVAYDKEENKPKQILSDLAPILLDRIFGEGAVADERLARHFRQSRRVIGKAYALLLQEQRYGTARAGRWLVGQKCFLRIRII